MFWALGCGLWALKWGECVGPVAVAVQCSLVMVARVGPAARLVALEKDKSLQSAAWENRERAFWIERGGRVRSARPGWALATRPKSGMRRRQGKQGGQGRQGGREETEREGTTWPGGKGGG